MNTKKGFTLVELLIVIAILAVLGVAVVLVLNPAELIRRSRDATRISDLATLNSAIAFYLTESSSPVLGTVSCGPRVTAGATHPFATATAATLNNTYTVDGNGWAGVNFSTLTGGSPLASLPRDPVNSTTHYYAYTCDQPTLKYEIDAKMESQKYSSGSTDVMSTDGGSQALWYEVGNALTL